MGLTKEQMRGVISLDGTTRAKIERAALNLFADHGIDGVSTRQIAAAANISEGAIYRHFSGKEELARALMTAIHERLTDMIGSARSYETIAEQISFIVHHYCQIADDDWALFRYHILYLHHFSKLSESLGESPLGVAALLLKEAMERGEIKEMDANIAASMALGIVVQTAQAKVLGFIDGPLSARADTFLNAILAVLRLNQEG